jgi:regulator of sigma E protease
MALLSQTFSVILLVVGFGFVIFWHELGHFLAAKWVRIKVEQFAVGMGHALVSFRKGIGLKLGNTRKQYEGRIREHLARKLGKAPTEEFSERELSDAGEELALGETEYRLSWIPVGGYVKMLGQDDMNPTAQADDPRAYNRKSVGARMFVISAGVIMNIILAGLLFMVLFLYGFRAPAPVVGMVAPNSPAQVAGVRVGDELVSLDGKPMHDFTKVMLNTALARPNEDIPLVVKRPDGKVETLTVRPRRQSPESNFVALGISPSPDLRGPKEALKDDGSISEGSQVRLLKAGDVITQVDGKDVRPGDPQKGLSGDYGVLDEALQHVTPQNPLKLTVRGADGASRTVDVIPEIFSQDFDHNFVAFAGMMPRMSIGLIPFKDSPLVGKAKAGDHIAQVVIHAKEGDRVLNNPGPETFVTEVRKAGDAGVPIDITVERDGKHLDPFKNLNLIKLESGRYGVGVAPEFDTATTIVGDVTDNSPAKRAGIPSGATVTAINGQPVRDWFEIRSALLAGGTADVPVKFRDAAGVEGEKTLALSAQDVEALRNIRYYHTLALSELIRIRQTGSPLTAMKWGVAETRDLILQFYVTLRRMVTRDVSPRNLMGPVGIFGAGAGFASKGTDWLIWFLAMISANLAVVNFLPIPIVDGGHFVFLLIEKIQGRPPSRRVLERAQLAGFIFIVGVFLFVTYNDIARMTGGH